MTKSPSTGAILTIINNDGTAMKTVLVRPLNETGQESVFVFDRSGDEHCLAKIVTSQSAYAVPALSKKHRISMAATM